METMCPKCGAEMLKEDNFCANCGFKRIRKIRTVCSRCGNSIDSSDKFCGNCGVKAEKMDEQEQQEIPANIPGATEYNKEAKSEDRKRGIEFFCIPFSKLIIMTFATLGIYMAYWTYKNWKVIKEQGKEDIRPFWRTFFALFYNYGLFNRILSAAEKQGYKAQYSAGLLYILQISGFILLRSEASGLWAIIGAALFLFPIYAIQESIGFNNYKISPDSFKKDYRFTGSETVLAVIMGLLFLNAILSSL